MQPMRDFGLVGSSKSQELEFPQQFTKSIKIEETAKGIRISIHLYETGGLDTDIDTVNRVLSMYNFTKEKAEQLNIPIAPMEVVK